MNPLPRPVPFHSFLLVSLFLRSLVLVQCLPLNFVSVDPVSGNDFTCQPLPIDVTTNPAANLLPCKTIDQAIVVLNTASNAGNVSSWLHLRPSTYQVSNLDMPQFPSFTLSIYLPVLPPGTSYSFPPTLSTNVSRVVWDCMNAQNCIRSSSASGSTTTIEGISFRNVLMHAIRHVGTMEQPADLTLNQVDCRDSGGLLYKSNGSVALNQVELVNATNYPGAVGFQSFVSLVHIVNANVTIIDSHFRDCQTNGSFKYPSSTMSIVSPSTFISFTMLRSEFRNNLFRTTFPPPKGSNSKYCTVGPGLIFNVSFSNIRVDSCDFADNAGYGDYVCGAGIGVFPFSDPDPTHSIDLRISSSRFWNNSLLKTSNAEGIGILVNYSGAATGPVVIIRNSSFVDHTGSNSHLGGIVGLRKTKLVNITDSYFAGNTLMGIKLLDFGFIGSIMLQNNILDGNFNPALLIAIISDLTIKDSVLRNGIGLSSSGAAVLYESDYVKGSPQVTIDNCLFANNSGGVGGGVTLKFVKAVISNTKFLGNSGDAGGAANFIGSTVSLIDCLFADNYVGEYTNYLSGNPPQGGSIYAVTSSVSVKSSRIVNSTIRSSNGIQACESASRGAIVSSSPRGGAFSLFQTSLVLDDCSIEGSFACIGGDMYANGETVYITSTTISNSRAMLGGSCAMKEAITFFTFDSTFTNVSSYSNGGAIILSNINQVLLSQTIFDTVQSIGGDGGVIHLSVMSTLASSGADGITFSNCSAPAGGGALSFFSTVDGGAVLSFDFTNEENMNTIVPPEGHFVEWGEIEATNVVRITSDVQSVSLYPGQHFYESQHATPFNISILAFDLFNQTVLGDRGMVIECSLKQLDGQMNLKPTLGGTALQQMTSARAAAVFDDLFITAEPGEYQLVFSVVGTPSIQSIIIPTEIRSECPSTLFYKKGTCTSCQSPLLVHDPSTDGCVSCDTGRVATSDGKCAICDLGYTNYGGPTCAKCASNMYQPNPLASCISCIGMETDGLSCNDGLAEVQPGYFAFSVFLDGDTTPSIHTVQCPSDGYCNGGPLQSNWSDPMNQFINRSASTVVPHFESAITRFDQCAYPSLASETNYLCGQCAPGLIVWGSKCSKCDHIDGGRMTLFIVLSFALVMFLVRASLASASAGHASRS